MKPKIIQAVQIITLLLFSVFIVMLVIYFNTFGANGVSSDVNDFAAFGGYIGGALTALSISVLLLTILFQQQISEEELEIMKGQIKASKDELELMKAQHQSEFEHRRRMEVIQKLDDINIEIRAKQKEKVYPKEYYDVGLQVGIINAEKYPDAESYASSMNDKRPMVFSTLINTIHESVINVKNGSYVDLKNHYEKLLNVKHLLPNLSTDYELMIIYLNELSTLNSNLNDVNIYINEHLSMMSILYNCGYMQSDPYAYADMLNRISKLIPVNQLVLDLFCFNDIYLFLVGLNPDIKYMSPDDLSIKFDSDRINAQVFQRSTGNLLANFKVPRAKVK